MWFKCKTINRKFSVVTAHLGIFLNKFAKLQQWMNSGGLDLETIIRKLLLLTNFANLFPDSSFPSAFEEVPGQKSARQSDTKVENKSSFDLRLQFAKSVLSITQGFPWSEKCNPCVSFGDSIHCVVLR